MKAQRRFVSGPCIARLLARHRVSVNEAMRAGRYGRLFHIGRIVYVDLTEVEHAEGLEVPAYNFDTGESHADDKADARRTTKRGRPDRRKSEGTVAGLAHPDR
jgi:hypothetical protein